MLLIGIDVAKDKHDCFICDSDGNVIRDVFTFSNDREGFNLLLSFMPTSSENVKVGLEATGHYSLNLINFLIDNGYSPVVFNPLQINLFRKAHTLRKTKTDKIDAKLIALMLSSSDAKPHLDLSYHVTELKSLTRYRSRLKDQLARLKISLARIIEIVFPELEDCVYSINQKSTMALLYEFPSKELIANAHLTRLTNLLKDNSKGRYSKDKALEIRNVASNSIGTSSDASSFELVQTIDMINFYSSKMDELDAKIEDIMIELNSPILSIPGISYNLGSIILAEIVDINRFDTPAQLQAFAGLDPTTHQSGKFIATGVSMVKRGSPYLRWAILNASRLIAMRDPCFKDYYQRKRKDGKHHFVALTHVAKKLIRVIFKLLKTNTQFVPQA
ncbi:IS110 family transposase [Globicatella sanguinis]|uniref:IS110 family transposase n=1 Tax=Globicatella sanguinis TaxID=13076 RepID=UPI0025427CB9|nr:IS110 family transposase [Globicatella sanguinis]WIK67053.1 IS110 family transposase [Globicatella sanguinis]WKT56458.1 IS110 family transposase [Globicatella sanguinis]